MRRSISRASKISNEPQDSLEGSFFGIPDVKWHEFLEKEETDFFILGLREEILCKCMELCFENYLEKQAVSFTVHCAYLALCKVLDMFYMFRDPGDTEDAEAIKSWEPDSEPEPSIIDSWGSECIMPLDLSQEAVKKESNVAKVATKPVISEEMESLESCSFVSDLFDDAEGEYFFHFSSLSSSSKSSQIQKLSIFTRTLSVSRISLPLIHPMNALNDCTMASVAGKKKKTGEINELTS